jgi:hypothetical protein
MRAPAQASGHSGPMPLLAHRSAAIGRRPAARTHSMFAGPMPKRSAICSSRFASLVSLRLPMRRNPDHPGRLFPSGSLCLAGLLEQVPRSGPHEVPFNSTEQVRVIFKGSCALAAGSSKMRAGCRNWRWGRGRNVRTGGGAPRRRRTADTIAVQVVSPAFRTIDCAGKVLAHA